jgi:hypothetical protein
MLMIKSTDLPLCEYLDVGWAWVCAWPRSCIALGSLYFFRRVIILLVLPAAVHHAPLMQRCCSWHLLLRLQKCAATAVLVCSVHADNHFNAALHGSIVSALDHSHIPALQSLLAGGDVEQQVAENTLAHAATSDAAAANLALAQYSHKILPDSIAHFDSLAMEAALAPQLVMNVANVQGGTNPSDIFGDMFAQGLCNTAGLGQQTTEHARSLPAAPELRRGGNPSDFYARAQLV